MPPVVPLEIQPDPFPPTMRTDILNFVTTNVTQLKADIARYETEMKEISAEAKEHQDKAEEGGKMNDGKLELGVLESSSEWRLITSVGAVEGRLRG